MGRSHDLARGASSLYQTQAASDTRYANVSGDTFTGAVNVDTSTTTNLTVNSANYGGIQFKAGGTKTGYITSFTGATESMYIGGADKVNIHTGTNHDLTGGTTRLQINAAGQVTMPYQPSFLAYRTNYTQNANAVGTIICPNVAHNTGNHYNSSNGTFTAPVAGRYLFMFWGLSYPHTTGVNYIAFYKNGGAYADLVQFGGNAQNHQPISGSMIIDCAVNDAITHVYYTQSASSKAYSGQWNFSGYLSS